MPDRWLTNEEKYVLMENINIPFALDEISSRGDETSLFDCAIIELYGKYQGQRQLTIELAREVKSLKERIALLESVDKA